VGPLSGDIMVDFFIAQNNKFYIIINKLFKTVKTDYDMAVKNKKYSKYEEISDASNHSRMIMG
jgi:hypothetical protein